MATFAVIEDGIVTNTIVADSKAIAEEVTGMTCVEYDVDDVLNVPTIGLGYDGNVFEKPFIPEEYLPTE